MSDTATRATRLLQAAKGRRLDPFTEIDWSSTWEGDEYFQMPPEKLPLFGTSIWHDMSETDRRIYSRHEAAAINAAGIFFENLAMQTILRHLGSIEVTDPAHQFLLLEVAEECKHSMMFGEYINWLSTPSYAPPFSGSSFRPAEGLPGRVTGFVLLLAVEELLDRMNRATMSDDRVHPVNRAISRIHVIEEARHVSFAHSYLRDLWPELTAEEQASTREFAPMGVEFVASFLVNDEVYANLGIDGGGLAARENEFHRRRIEGDLARLTDYLFDLGVIDESSARLWQRQGLLAAA